MVIRLPKFDDEYVADQFVQLQRPLFWWKKGRELAEAAEIILRSHNRTAKDQKEGRRYRRMIMPGIWQEVMQPISYEPANLLYALAIENALKGIVVGRDNSLISPKTLARIFKSTRHNLRELGRVSGLHLSIPEQALLDKLTATIKWVGRYPTPLNEDDLMPTDENGSHQYPGLSWWGTDREDTRTFFRRLDTELIALLHDRFSEGSV